MKKYLSLLFVLISFNSFAAFSDITFKASLTADISGFGGSISATTTSIVIYNPQIYSITDRRFYSLIPTNYTAESFCKLLGKSFVAYRTVDLPTPETLVIVYKTQWDPLYLTHKDVLNQRISSISCN